MSLNKVAVNLIYCECAGELIFVEKDMWSADISHKSLAHIYYLPICRNLFFQMALSTKAAEG